MRGSSINLTPIDKGMNVGQWNLSDVDWLKINQIKTTVSSGGNLDANRFSYRLLAIAYKELYEEAQNANES